MKKVKYTKKREVKTKNKILQKVYCFLFKKKIIRQYHEIDGDEFTEYYI